MWVAPIPNRAQDSSRRRFLLGVCASAGRGRRLWLGVAWIFYTAQPGPGRTPRGVISSERRAVLAHRLVKKHNRELTATPLEPHHFGEWTLAVSICWLHSMT
jgi:hypothetical protein